MDEHNDNTWDFQRLSSLSPWSLTVGKLMGGPVCGWYGGLICLAVYIISGLQIQESYWLFLHVVLAVLAALICQSLAIAASLQAINMRTARARIRPLGAHVLGVLAGIPFLPWMDSLMVTPIPQPIKTVMWYGTQFERTVFLAALGMAVLAWIIGGVYWQMRSQLRMRTGPYYWIGLSLFMLAVACGFGVSARSDWHSLQLPAMAFGLNLALLYAMAFIEPWSGISYRKWLEHYRQHRRTHLLHNLPRWVASLMISLILFAWAIVAGVLEPNHRIVTITLLGFVLRDIAILHYFRLNPSARRPQATALFYLIMLYFLLPLLLQSLQLEHAAQLFAFVPLTYPLSDTLPLTMTSSFVQAALAIALAYHQWRRHWRITKDANPT